LPAEETKARMKEILADVQNGSFAARWIEENKNGRPLFNAKREELYNHPMEVVGRQLREKMLWEGDTDLDSASQ
jgi:ketol-acid reductoisomerase